MFLVAWDVAALTVAAYQFARAGILRPLGFTSSINLVFWGAVMTAWMLAAHRARLWGGRGRVPRAILEWLMVVGAVAAVTYLSHIEATGKGEDWSWLRSEIIKTPWWDIMYFGISPLYFAGFLATALIAIRVTQTRPLSRWAALASTAATVALVWVVWTTLAPFGAPNDGSWLFPRKGMLLFFMAIFCLPAVLISALLWGRWFSAAFRALPLAFHMSLLALNYVGVLPVHALADLNVFRAEEPAEIRGKPGVRQVFPRPGTRPDASFQFLRKIVPADGQWYLNYGPTCGIYALDTENGEARHLALEGLMRDVKPAPDGDGVWGLDWFNGEFLHIRGVPPRIVCRCDLFAQGVTTPYEMMILKDRMFVTNVTPPTVVELVREEGGDACSWRAVRSLDLRKSGFTLLSDGAYGMHYVPETDRLYLVVALIEDRNISSFFEIDAKRLKVLRELRLRTANPVFPIPGRAGVLIPAYYTPELHEVSLETMTILRTIKTAPNVGTLVVDAKRGLFYALSRAKGTLMVIDDEPGRVVGEWTVGDKPDPISLDEPNDRLLIAGGAGVFEIDLAPFLAAEGIRP